jgi:hydrogenase maturation protein HypF
VNADRSSAPTILACGAWMKNAACLLHGERVHWSALHGDLDDPANCSALEQSVAALLTLADGRIDAVAHDLHPDFFSTRLAQRVAFDLGVPAIGVQHHHAHIAAVMAEHGWQQPVIGLALDGVGLGSDGAAWGGELLLVDPTLEAAGLEPEGWRRLGHLQPLALPGGDVAARQPWRMAASTLHALGRGAEIGPRFGPVAGPIAARTVQTMLERSIHCPPTSSAGRWFDAAAGALGICSLQQAEAQAAIALEQLAQQHLAQHGADIPASTLSDGYVLHADGRLDLRPVLALLLALDHDDRRAVGRGAALFHLTLVDALVHWASRAASVHGIKAVALGGGCFMNRIVKARLTGNLERRALRVLSPQSNSCGDAGLALGQAWVARSSHVSQSVGAAG